MALDLLDLCDCCWCKHLSLARRRYKYRYVNPYFNAGRPAGAGDASDDPYRIMWNRIKSAWTAPAETSQNSRSNDRDLQQIQYNRFRDLNSDPANLVHPELEDRKTLVGVRDMVELQMMTDYALGKMALRTYKVQQQQAMMYKYLTTLEAR